MCGDGPCVVGQATGRGGGGQEGVLREGASHPALEQSRAQQPLAANAPCLYTEKLLAHHTNRPRRKGSRRTVLASGLWRLSPGSLACLPSGKVRSALEQCTILEYPREQPDSGGPAVSLQSEASRGHVEHRPLTSGGFQPLEVT